VECRFKVTFEIGFLGMFNKIFCQLRQHAFFILCNTTYCRDDWLASPVSDSNYDAVAQPQGDASPIFGAPDPHYRLALPRSPWVGPPNFKNVVATLL
jgi:hypothetical protein